MLKFLFFLTITLMLSFSAQPQVNYAFSQNGKNMVCNTENKIVMADGTRPNMQQETIHDEVVVYNLQTYCMQARFYLPIHKGKIEQIKIAGNNRQVHIVTSDRQFIYDIGKEKIIFHTFKSGAIAFSNNTTNFYMADVSSIKEYDGNGVLVNDYELKIEGAAKEFFVSRDDQLFFYANHRGKMHVYRNGVNRPVRKLKAHEMSYNSTRQTLTTIFYRGNSVDVIKYQLPQFYQVAKINSSRFIKDYQRKISSELKAAGEKKAKLPAQITDVTNTQLSPQGTYLRLATKTTNLISGAFVIDIEINEELMTIEADEKGKPIVSRWVNDSLLLVDVSENSGRLFNTKVRDFEGNVSYYFPELNEELRLKKQMKKRFVSPDWMYTIMPYKSNGDWNIYLKNNAYFQKPSHVVGAKPITYDEWSNYVLVERPKEGDLGVIPLKFVDYDLGTGAIEPKWFCDSVVPVNENVINDTTIPDDFVYHRLLEVNHLKELNKNEGVNIVFKTMTMKDSLVKLQVQLIDNNGTYYKGAAKGRWKNIWCNLLIASNGTIPSQPKNIKIEEISEEIPSKRLIAVIMDNSGSMGIYRANKLQEGVANLIETKSPDDDLMLIYYDDKVFKAAPPMNDSEKLLKMLYNSQYRDFMGATALLDGINEAVNQMKKEEGYDSKSVVIITDGQENSSFISKNSLILNAIDANVDVHTIAFGNFVSEHYLKSIAYNTKGSYYHIYSPNDLSWIFNDIFNKVKNYYQIEFTTDTLAMHDLMLSICPDKAKGDTLITNFDNQPIDYSKINPQSDIGFDYVYDKEVSIDKKKEKEKFFSSQTTYKSLTIEEKDTTTPEKEKLIVEELEIEKEFKELDLPVFEFQHGKTRMINDPQEELKNLADFLKKNPEANLQIIGHTDNTGSKRQNKKLSLNRALMIKELLSQKGIQQQRMEAIGMGSELPIQSNETEEGRQKNRRVEFILITD